MNRKERRRAAATAKPLDPVVAIHEAGHAVARFVTAADMMRRSLLH